MACGFAAISKVLAVVFTASTLVAATPAWAAGADLAKQLKLECAQLAFSQRDGRQTLKGFVMNEPDLQTTLSHAKKNGAASDVRVVPWPACEAMLALGTALEAPNSPGIRTSLGRTALKIGEGVAFEVTAPDFPAFLYIVYLQTDGTVVNLLPRQDLMREQTRPGWKRVFGDGTGGLPRFKVTAPAGDEAVVVIASRTPVDELEALERPGRPFRLQLATGARGGAEDKAFLDVLKRGIAAAQAGKSADNGNISAAVLHLQVGD